MPLDLDPASPNAAGVLIRSPLAQRSVGSTGDVLSNACRMTRVCDGSWAVMRNPTRISPTTTSTMSGGATMKTTRGPSAAVNLPPRSSVVIRIPFLDFTGKFVYHCHILAHEDFGMISVIEVVE